MQKKNVYHKNLENVKTRFTARAAMLAWY